MKIALLVEGLPDLEVCLHLAKRLQPESVFVGAALGKKPKLLATCGLVAEEYIADGADRVIILWDLHPATWEDVEPGGKTKPCRKEDRERVFASLDEAGVDGTMVALVCIDAMLETWLLADNRALEDFLSKPHRPVRIRRDRRPEQHQDPKSRLIKTFAEAGRKGRRSYNDTSDAIQIARAMPDLQRLRRVASFRRFAEKAAGVDL